MKEKKLSSPNEILEDKIDRLYRRREWKRFLAELVVLVAAVYVVFHFIIGIGIVSGDSMQPTLEDGEIVVFYRLDNSYQKNDLVVVQKEDDLEYIKRVAAVGGDVLELEEETYEIPAESYFVLGDNQEESRDSRSFGPVTEEEILGRVFFHMGMTK